MVSEQKIEERFQRLRESMLASKYEDIDTWRDEWKAVLRNTLGSIPEGEDALAILKAESVAAVVVGLLVARMLPNVFNHPWMCALVEYTTANKHLPDILYPSERLVFSLLGYYYLRCSWPPTPTGAV